MKEIKEFHQQGRVSIDNVTMIEQTDSSNVDVGLQVAKDGRIWLCVNGIALIRFTPNPEVIELTVLGNPERRSVIIEALLDTLNRSDKDSGLCIVERPEPITPPDVEMILKAHPIELLESSPRFNEKPPRRCGQKHNQWKNVKKLK